MYLVLLQIPLSIIGNIILLLYRRVALRLLGKLKTLVDMWKVQAVVVQLLLLGCLLHLYFEGRLLSNLKPQQKIPELGIGPPANRLVVFLTDGLSAESFFADNCSSVPHLREVFAKQGLVGISRGSVPTLVRSGQIAIFGGFYESPPLLRTGFQWNPPAHDTVFNRSKTALCWIERQTNIFAKKLTLGMFQDNSAGPKPMEPWALLQLCSYLSINSTVDQLRSETSLIFFVNLGNIAAESPLSQRYRERLHSAQRGIREAYDLIESAFDDNRTAYLMTSSHGISQTGSNVAGSSDETETPFFLWGSGVAQNGNHNGGLPQHRPRIELQQIQLTAIISALIGEPPPVNNLGRLPSGFLDVSMEQEAQASHLNALQLLAQAQLLLRHHKNAFFYKFLPQYKHLDQHRIESLRLEMDRQVRLGIWQETLQTIDKAATLAQESLKYYHGYYHIPLLLATMAGLLGWIYCLLGQVSKQQSGSQSSQPPESMELVSWTTVMIGALGVMFSVVILLQKIPLLTGFCILLPIYIWCMALAGRPCIRLGLLHLKWILVSTVCFIVSIYRRDFLCLLYVGIVCFYNRSQFKKFSSRFLAWMGLVCCLSAILFYLQYPSVLSLTIQYGMYLQGASMALAILRPLISGEKHGAAVWIINAGVLLIGGYGMYLRDTESVPLLLHAVCWTHLIYAFGSVPYGKRLTPKRRLERICFDLTTLHTLLSDSFASLFAQALIIEYQMGIEVHLETKQLRGFALDQIQMEEDGIEEQNEPKTVCPKENLARAYCFSFSTLLYFLLSLHCTGHWIASFTFAPSTARLFAKDCCYGFTAFFVLLKIYIPSIVILSSMYARSKYARKNIRSIFICLMLTCNAGLCLFLFVNHDRFWPASHPSVVLVILISTAVVFLLLCSCVASVFFRGSLQVRPTPTSSSKRNKELSSSESDEQTNV
ncbi:GPI ethanolamine phosphate transferase 1 [Drosophila guanche]|uniref:GPI ethanolamine phosphate transferase 1 n=1 Tax=Drosophila guanche TaxID=7266 RepID=A0A3B0KIW5_DROGU|nr:GPI ethanolamine phosphate transferase 1 [Drosophila guanche]SPP88470.1 blast:GPI ethanolamine phosphate transferase 1 [Drosophila guanche]